AVEGGGGTGDEGWGVEGAGAKLMSKTPPLSLRPSRAARRRPRHAPPVGLRDVERPIHLRHAGPAPRAGEGGRGLPRTGGCHPLRGVFRRQRRGGRAPPWASRPDPPRPPPPRPPHRRPAPLAGPAPPLPAPRTE